MPPAAARNRRTHHRFGGVAVAVVFLAVASCRKEPRPATAPAPAGLNVLLITLDTTRVDCLGCYGQRAIATPNIDALAARGMRFTQCTSAAPITLPSHASIMTATYPFVHRARNNGRYLADEGNVTLAERLKGAGYATGAEVGAFVLDAAWGIAQGFDSFRSTKAKDGWGPHLERLVEEQSVPADDVCDRAVEWLGQHGRDRFFLWVHFFDPHLPYRPPERFRKLYADPYLGEIAFVDEQLGRLFAELRRQQLESTTLIVLTADHGEGRFEHQEPTHTYFVYDSTLHVPLIIVAPGTTAGGRVCAAQVRTVDIAPTVLALAGLPPPADAQGVSLVSLLNGQAQDLALAAYGESVAAHEAYGYARLWSYRSGGWKYIQAPRPELYDLRADPKELVNVAARDPGRTRAMREGLEALLQAGTASAAGAAPAPPLDSAALARLTALGYVGGYVPPDPPDEMRAFRESVGPDPKEHVEAYSGVLKAQALIDAGQSDAGLALLREWATAEPSNPGFQEALGRELQRIGRSLEAAQAYEAVVRLQPDNALARYHLGRALAAGREPASAVPHLQRAAEAMPRDGEVLLALAVVLVQVGQRNAAEAPLRQVLELDPGNDDACTHLSAVLQARGQFREGGAVLRAGWERRPDSVKIANNLAWFLATIPAAELRNGAEAVRLAEGLQSRGADGDADTLDTLAAAYAEAGRFSEAVAAARRALAAAEQNHAGPATEPLRARLALYEAGQPYRENPAAGSR
jgi:arylsulfatase A-like enzyme/Flp pilus assembly protein TadD